MPPMPGVYAAGDVASYDGVSIGIWNQATEMGRIAGANAVGDNLIYGGITPACSFSGFGIDLFAIGDAGKKEGEIYKTLEVDDPRMLSYRKLFYLHDILVGAVVIGDTAFAGKILEAYEKGLDFEDSLALIHGWK